MAGSRRAERRWLIGFALLPVLVSCGSSESGSQVELRVLAAASLTDVLTEIAAAFEADHPGVEVDVSFAGSTALVTQVLDGAPADVLATANEATMDEAVSGDTVRTGPETFARNALVLAVPEGNPAGVTGLDDLADEGLFVGLCAEEVPCGELAGQVLADAGVAASVDTREPDVRSLLTKLASGDLDAGLVYRTDALAAEGDVDVVEVPSLDRRTTSYPIASLRHGDEPSAADRFVAYVLSDEAQTILASHGFRGA